MLYPFAPLRMQTAALHRRLHIAGEPLACCPQRSGRDVSPELLLRNSTKQVCKLCRYVNVLQAFELAVPLFVHPARHQEVAASILDVPEHQLHADLTVAVVFVHHHAHGSVPANLQL